MRLKSLEISRDWCNDDQYKGAIEIDGESSAMKFKLDNDRALRFLELALTEFKLQSDDFAQNLLSDLKAVQCQNLLPSTPASTEQSL